MFSSYFAAPEPLFEAQSLENLEALSTGYQVTMLAAMVLLMRFLSFGACCLHFSIFAGSNRTTLSHMLESRERGRVQPMSRHLFSVPT